MLASCVVTTFFCDAQNQQETLIVGVPTDRCPMFYRDEESGEIMGIGVDLMNIAAEEAGYTAEFVELSEPTIKDSLDNTRYDVILPFGSAIFSTGGQPSVVSENLIQTPFTLVTQKKTDLSDISHVKVGMLASLKGISETIGKLYPEMEITLYDTMPECVEALRSGQVQALLHNAYVWSYVLQKPAYSDLIVHPTSMLLTDFRVGAQDTKEGRATILRLNTGIETITDAQRDAIVLDYTTRRLYQYSFADYIFVYRYLLVLGGIFIIGLMLWIYRKQRTLRMEHEEKMRQLIDHDPLTGVLSMNGFRKKVLELLAEHPDIPYMISYNNIRDFKFVNDSLGKEAGDDLLRFWADKSMEVLTDEEAMGRIESDHFVVLRSVGNSERTNDIKTVFEPVRNFFIDQGKDVQVLLSGGVYVLTPEDYEHPDIDHMLDFARVAEKQVRETIKEGFIFYNPNQWEKERWTADVVGHLRTAIKTGELAIWYQPQVNYRTKEITGAEALCRWSHRKLGCIPPSEFIPALESSGCIYELDCYVWDHVCQDLQRWNRFGKRQKVSVNVSRYDIQNNRNLAEHFMELVKKYELDVEQLRIEITESAYVEDSNLLIQTTHQLKECGFRVEMDDFGSGYSSLNMLKEVPVDRIKLDFRFLTGGGDPVKGRIIVGCMIQMADALGMDIIAEGVETLEQAKSLSGMGCNEMQGCYFYKPVSVVEFESLM